MAARGPTGFVDAALAPDAATATDAPSPPQDAGVGVDTPSTPPTDTPSTPPTDTPSTPPTDTPSTPPTDTPSVGCMSDRVCGGDTPRCDRALGRCVACVTNAHCPSTSVCAGGRCVTATACMSSRTCPGQVCDTARMQCVDCVSNADCAAPNRCQDGACVPPPRSCVSSRECSALDQVCDAARMQCVDCVGNNDCQATEYCAAGVCRSRVCTGGRGDCDNDPTNGCEVDLQTSAAHCGACGAACAGTASTAATCAAGACRRSCNAGYGDCDGNTSNGCEVDLRASNAHCGACGRACASGTSCVAGACASPPVTPAQLLTPRMGAGLVRYPDGRVMLIGGLGNSTALTSTEIYDPGTNRWSAGPALPEPLNGPAAALTDDGRVFVFGGLGNGTSTPVGSVYVLTSPTGAWQRAGTLPQVRYGAVAMVVGGRIWVLGGLVTTSGTTTRVEVYDPATQGFSAGPPMNTARSYFGAAQTADGRIWAFGGLVSGNASTAECEVYTPATGRWTATTALPTPLGGSGAHLASDGRLYLAGGYLTSGYTNALLQFDFATQRWSTGPMLPQARGFGRLIEAPTGVLLYLGGRDSTTLGLSNVWALTLGATTWR